MRAALRPGTHSTYAGLCDVAQDADIGSFSDATVPSIALEAIAVRSEGLERPLASPALPEGAQSGSNAESYRRSVCAPMAGTPALGVDPLCAVIQSPDSMYGSSAQSLGTTFPLPDRAV